jgi:plasmid stabilization system protein ParE
MIKVEFHPEAEQDLSEAKSWYRERSKLAARAFATEFAYSVRQIAGRRIDPENDVLSFPGFLFQSCIESGPTQYSLQ